MTRAALNFIIDLITLVVMLAMISTGLLVRYILPRGSGERLSAWNMSRHEWGDVHFWLAVSLCVLLLLHLALHWHWACKLVRRWFRAPDTLARPQSALRRNLGGMALLLGIAGLIAAFLWVVASNVVDSQAKGRQLRRGRDAAAAMPPPPPVEARPLVESTADAGDMETADGIHVYYFHRTLRCQTCLTIEAYARDAIHEHFAGALQSGLMQWRAVNIEEPQHAHFEADFQLQAQSLILAEIADGRCVRWKNLTEVWNLVDSRSAFSDYVHREVAEFAGG